MAPILSVQNLSKQYEGGFQALKNVNLDIDQGEILARAFCEAVVQRTPLPIKPSKVGLNPADPGERNEFGRRFTIHSFRWLNPDEI